MTKRVGDFMLEIGAMTQPQVEEIARLQKGGDSRRFGEIAVALGYITEEDIRHYVEHLGGEGQR
jgi:hypothetical protein